MSDEEKRSLSWTPVRRGAHYCSPACGHGCLLEQYNAALRGADALTDALGSGWAMRVWENLGWHYGAESACKRISVYPASSGYTAFLSERGPGGRWVANGKTPCDAVRNVIQVMQDDLRAFKDLIDRGAAVFFGD